jgi:hypothetical protein
MMGMTSWKQSPDISASGSGWRNIQVAIIPQKDGTLLPVSGTVQKGYCYQQGRIHNENYRWSV